MATVGIEPTTFGILNMLNHEVILLKNESSDRLQNNLVTELGCVAISNQYTLINLDDFKTPHGPAYFINTATYLPRIILKTLSSNALMHHVNCKTHRLL